MAKKEKQIIPAPSDAEKWIDPDVFKWKGKLWRVLPDMRIVLERGGK